MQLNTSNKVKLNSVVLIRNIANETKREPLKLARIVKIHDSRDETQRVVTLTYSNVRKNKDGKWIGTRMTVDRSVNDIIPVDTALNDSMLNCSKQSDNTATTNEEDDTEGNEEDNEELVNDEEDTVEKEEANIADKECDTVQLRRSERVRKQRHKLNPDDIGNDENDSDEDYIPEV